MFERIKTFFGAETRATTLSDPGPLLLELFGALPTQSGISVGPQSALESPTTLAAIRTIAETIGALPVQVFERSSNGSRERNTSHPAARLLGGDWTPWASSIETRTQMQTDALQFGAGYAQAVRVQGQVRELHRLEPTAVTPQHDGSTGEPSYRVRLGSGGEATLPWRDVVVVRVPGSSINRPLCLTHLAREAIGIDIAMAGHQGRIFKNGGRPSGIISYTKMLSQEVLARLKASIEQNHAGGSSGRTMILEDGMTFAPLQFSSVDLQFLELRRFAIQEIARVFKVPSTFLGDLDRATWRNVEELSRQFVTYTLLPWLDQWQAALSRVLFTDDERTRFFVEFQTADLLRGDAAARFAAYRNAAGGSWLTPNEVRGFENLPARPDGDDLIKQAGQSGALPAPNDGTAS